MSEQRAVMKDDVSEEMQQDAVEWAKQAFAKYYTENNVASHIKKEFDKKYNPTWHCIVGKNLAVPAWPFFFCCE